MSIDLDVGGEAPLDPEELEAAGTPPAEISPLHDGGRRQLTVSDLAALARLLPRGGRARDAGDRLTGARRSGRAGASCSCWSRSRARVRRAATPGSSTSRCSFRSAPTSRAGLPMPRATGSGSKASRITTSARRSTSATPTATGSRSTPTGRATIWEGKVAGRMTTLPLDVDSLLGVLDDPAHGAVRRARGRHRDGPRPSLRRLDRRHHRLLPRRRSASG